MKMARQPYFMLVNKDKSNIVKLLLEKGADIPGITSLKYNKLFLKHKFKDFHHPKVDLSGPDLKGEDYGLEKEKLSLKILTDKQRCKNISDEADFKWKDAYLRERLSNNLSSEETLSSFNGLPDTLRSTLMSNYEFDEEEDAKMRSSFLTEDSAKELYNQEIENLKILVHVLNEKLESTSMDYSDQVEEIMKAK